MLEDGSKTTIFHKIYGTDMEHQLSQPGISLGALSHLPIEENPTLIHMKQAYGEQTAVRWLWPHVTALNAAAGASNRMDKAASILCCRDIIMGFPYLTLAEFCVFCQRMRTLQYASKRSDYVFSSDTIMQGLREFARDRAAAIDKYEREHPKPLFHGDEISREEWLKMRESYCKKNNIDISMPDTRGPLAEGLEEWGFKYKKNEGVNSNDEVCDDGSQAGTGNH